MCPAGRSALNEDAGATCHRPAAGPRGAVRGRARPRGALGALPAPSAGMLRAGGRGGDGQGPGGMGCKGQGPVPAQAEPPHGASPVPAAALPRYLRAASARLPAAARRRRHLRRGGRFRWWWRRGRPDVGTRHPVTARPGATCRRCRRRCRRCRLVPPASHGEPAAARTTANMAARPVRPLPAGRREGGRGETLGDVKPPPPSWVRAALRPLAGRGSGGGAAGSNPARGSRRPTGARASVEIGGASRSYPQLHHQSAAPPVQIEREQD